MLPRTTLYRWLAVVFVVLVFYFHPDFSGSSFTSSSSPFGGELDTTAWVKQVLQLHSIGPKITYAARTIQYIPDAKERLPISEIDHDLFPDKFQEITTMSKGALPVGKTLHVHVKQLSRPDDVDASSLIFGVSTTFDRFNDDRTGPINEWVRWLTDGKGRSNGAGLILALYNTTQTEIDHAGERLAAAGINATVVPSNPSLDMPGRYVDLVQMLYNHPTRKQRKYFALVDDDTFFPCMSELLRTLFQYDYKKPYYIGTFTERVDWMLSNHAPMAYGGGGIFLTAPVAREIVKLPCLQKDDDGTYVMGGDQGDRLLYNCLHQNTEIALTYLPLLHQLDHYGDPSGFYENGRQPLSLHHYKSWHNLEPAKIHVVADACGEDCVLQRFQFKDNFVISNGYSVSEYPHGIDFDLLQMEATFDIPSENDFQDVLLSYSFGEMRKDLSKTGRKRSWHLLDSRKERDGKVKQIYLKRRGDNRWMKEGEDHPENDSIVVLTWAP
ncbi:hypothetical protein G7Y89_g4728 [Cudoniella acicularis]|uniref:Glycosyltransferase family 31 protein n=1 Tax=Cudoniella acicularis TaxID=354080 RepID=A0A8H4RNV5_9HELO|nr:hypothetical protein G7Y89_g4728 [Cudoniella acicularis]